MTLVGIVFIMMLALFLGTRSREYRLNQLVIILLLTLMQVAFVAFSLYNEDEIPSLSQSALVGTP